MKIIPVVLERFLKEEGVGTGTGWIPSLHVHDEVQGSLRPGLQEAFKRAVDKAFAFTQDLLNVQVPLVGGAEFGSSWAQTH